MAYRDSQTMMASEADDRNEDDRQVTGEGTNNDSDAQNNTDESDNNDIDNIDGDDGDNNNNAGDGTGNNETNLSGLHRNNNSNDVGVSDDALFLDEMGDMDDIDHIFDEDRPENDGETDNRSLNVMNAAQRNSLYKGDNNNNGNNSNSNRNGAMSDEQMMLSKRNSTLSTESSGSNNAQQNMYGNNNRVDSANPALGGKRRRSNLSKTIEHGDRGIPPPSWHCEAADKGDRQEMILEIAHLLQIRKKSRPTAEWLHQLPHKARRLEDRLYRAAPSLEAYKDRATLKNRLNKLAKVIMMKYGETKRARMSKSTSVVSQSSSPTQNSTKNSGNASIKNGHDQASFLTAGSASIHQNQNMASSRGSMTSLSGPTAGSLPAVKEQLSRNNSAQTQSNSRSSELLSAIDPSRVLAQNALKASMANNTGGINDASLSRQDSRGNNFGYGNSNNNNNNSNISVAGRSSASSASVSGAATNSVDMSRPKLDHQQMMNERLQQQILENMRQQEELVRQLQSNGGDMPHEFSRQSPSLLGVRGSSGGGLNGGSNSNIPFSGFSSSLQAQLRNGVNMSGISQGSIFEGPNGFVNGLNGGNASASSINMSSGHNMQQALQYSAASGGGSVGGGLNSQQFTNGLGTTQSYLGPGGVVSQGMNFGGPNFDRTMNPALMLQMQQQHQQQQQQQLQPQSQQSQSFLQNRSNSTTQNHDGTNTDNNGYFNW